MTAAHRISMPGKSLALTIIIVNWNGGEELRCCLASIQRHADPKSVQVLVMDNNSRDGSREMVQREFPGIRVINTGANLGFGKANNLARAQVSTPLVLFLNPDTEVLEHALSTMVDFMAAHPEIGAIGCTQRDAGGPPHELPMQWETSPWTQFLQLVFVASDTPVVLKRFLPYADPCRSGYVNKLFGGCIMARTVALDEVGWFDERYFMYAEDVDLSLALVQHGWKLYYLSEAEIIHSGGGSSRKTKKEFPILMKCESIGQLMRKQHGQGGEFMYRLAVMLGGLCRLLMLAILRVFSFFSPAGYRSDLAAPIFKYRTMILWSLWLRRPMIPQNVGLATGSQAKIK